MESVSKITENELFTSQTKLNEILKLHINEVARYRWFEYQKCWSAADFLWWEYSAKEIEIIISQLVPYLDSPKPKRELATDLLIYATMKEQLYSIIKSHNLLEAYIFYCDDFDGYAKAKKQQPDNYIKKLERELDELNPRRHLKIIKHKKQ